MDAGRAPNQDSLGKKLERNDGGRVAKTRECEPSGFQECKVECRDQVASGPSNCPVLRRRPAQEMPFEVVGSQPSAPSARSAPPAVAWDQDASTESVRQWKEQASLRSAESEIRKPGVRSAEPEIKAADRPGPMTPPEASASAMPPSPVGDLLMTLKCLFEMSEGSERSKSLFTGCSTVRILF